MFLQALNPARSIRAKLFFQHFFILAPFVVLSAVWITDSMVDQRNRLISQLEEKANRTVTALSVIVRDETAVVGTMGEFAAMEEGKPAETTYLLSAMLPHHPFESNFHFIDTKGTLIASAIPISAEEETSSNKVELQQRVMVTGQASLGHVELAREGRATGQPVVPLAVPVHDSTGKLLGVLMSELITSEVERLVVMAPDSRGGYVFVVDSVGQVIAHPNEEFARTFRDFSEVPAVREILKGQEGMLEYTDPVQGSRLFAVYKRVPVAGWGVVSVYPSEVISATTAQTGFGNSVIFGIAIAFAVLAAYASGNRLANRMAKLASAASAVSAGEVERQIEPTSDDEMGAIARSLNLVSGRLRDQLASLQAVTQALKRSCDDVGSALASRFDIDEAVRLALSSAARLIGVEAAMGLITENEGNLRVLKVIGPVPPRFVGQLWPLEDRASILSRTVAQCQFHQLRDVFSPELPPDPLVALGRESGFRAALVVPLVSYGKCLGALLFFDTRTPRVFQPEEIASIRSIASEAAIAMETARFQQQTRLANEQLLLAGIRLRDIIETIPEGVLVAEAPDGRITMSNSMAEQLLGRPINPQADLHEQPQLYGFYRREGQPYLANELPLYRSIVLGEADTREIMVKRPDGKEITLLFSSAPLIDREAKPIGGVGVFRDISEMKELDRLKDIFISITSHELKNPMTVIKGYAQLLLRKVEKTRGREDEVKWLQAIADQSGRLSTMVERLLDVSRIQTGRLELVPAPMDLVALARKVVEQEQVTTQSHQIRVYSDVPELVGDWDKGRIEQVLINLIDNAIKYSPLGGPIDVDVRRIDDEAQVSVHDHGVGIPKEEQKRIFERFYRAQVEQGPAGLGLGLFISYQIVSLHGGRMWVESEPGQGSTFYLTLPLRREEQHQH